MRKQAERINRRLADRGEHVEEEVMPETPLYEHEEVEMEEPDGGSPEPKPEPSGEPATSEGAQAASEGEPRAKRNQGEETADERVTKKARATQRGGKIRKDEELEEPEAKRRRENTRVEDIMISQLRKMEEELRRDTPDVAEIFSPTRVSKVGKGLGLVAGEAMDLITGWDFSLEADRRKAWGYIRAERPKLIIGSPPCTMFSQLMTFSGDPKVRDRQGWEDVVTMLNFAISMCRKQSRVGRNFGFEHLLCATSWKSKSLEALQRVP